jgi:hypothetical protein
LAACWASWWTTWSCTRHDPKSLLQGDLKSYLVTMDEHTLVGLRVCLVRLMQNPTNDMIVLEHTKQI